ncbi:MAG: hypothetical protein JSW49_05540 [candidate division WOR-3 bacterium]|nr:MAG: hypothetical protein JSW49_05540 [candidate division WOR-3 bacterium]
MKKVTAEMPVDTILEKEPRLARLFIDAGLPCIVCGEPFWGTVRELCDQRGVNCTELVELLNKETDEINEKS